MKKKHSPVSKKTILIRFLAVMMWFVPVVLNFILWYIFSGKDTSFMILGVIGSFVIGFALSLLVASIEPEAFGITFHKKLIWIVIIVSSMGLILVAISALMIFVPQIYMHFREDLVIYYFFIWGAFFITALCYYALFRPNIYLFYRKKGLRKRDIKELIKGKKNYWWFTALNRTYSMGNIRYVNIIFTIVYTVTICLHLILGWWGPILATVGVMTAILLILCGILLIWGGIKSGFEPLTEKIEKKKKYSTLALLGYFAYVILLIQSANYLITNLKQF